MFEEDFTVRLVMSMLESKRGKEEGKTVAREGEGSVSGLYCTGSGEKLGMVEKFGSMIRFLLLFSFPFFIFLREEEDVPARFLCLWLLFSFLGNRNVVPADYTTGLHSHALTCSDLQTLECVQNVCLG